MAPEIHPMVVLIRVHGVPLNVKCHLCGWRTVYAVGEPGDSFTACSRCDVTQDEAARVGLDPYLRTF